MGMCVIEQDPHGKNPHESGAKLDAGKPKPDLILRSMAKALSAVIDVATYGANKYTDDGWEDVPDGIRRYTNAMFRHYLAEACGEGRDPDSQLLHAAHTAWNALARLELIIRDYENAFSEGGNIDASFERVSDFCS